MLIYLLDDNVIPSFLDSFQALIDGNKKPSWCYRFTEDWKKLASTFVTGTYLTDHSNWKCDCPSFCHSEYSLCKHLVCGKTLSRDRDLIRFSKPPFISFRFLSDRPFLNYNDSYVSWFGEHCDIEGI